MVWLVLSLTVLYASNAWNRKICSMAVKYQKKTLCSSFSVLQVKKCFKIEVQLIYSVVLVSNRQQSDSIIHIYMPIYCFSDSFIIHYYEILSIVPITL